MTSPFLRFCALCCVPTLAMLIFPFWAMRLSPRPTPHPPHAIYLPPQGQGGEGVVERFLEKKSQKGFSIKGISNILGVDIVYAYERMAPIHFYPGDPQSQDPEHMVLLSRGHGQDPPVTGGQVPRTLPQPAPTKFCF